MILDATYRPSGDRVCIKITKRATREAQIASYLSSERKLLNPSNHCVPVLEVLPDPLNPLQELLVMPYYLRPFNDPEFCTIGEVVEFIRQTLEVRN